jgi:hypothetical protein
MSAAELIEKEAKAQGVILALSPDWHHYRHRRRSRSSTAGCPSIRENKPGILRANYSAKRRRTKDLGHARSGSPSALCGSVVDDASTDPVVVAVAHSFEVATFELEIPLKYYDALVLLELLEKHSAAEHRDA